MNVKPSTSFFSLFYRIPFNSIMLFFFLISGRGYIFFLRVAMPVKIIQVLTHIPPPPYLEAVIPNI